MAFWCQGAGRGGTTITSSGAQHCSGGTVRCLCMKQSLKDALNAHCADNSGVDRGQFGQGCLVSLLMRGGRVLRRHGWIQ